MFVFGSLVLLKRHTHLKNWSFSTKKNSAAASSPTWTFRSKIKGIIQKEQPKSEQKKMVFFQDKDDNLSTLYPHDAHLHTHNTHKHTALDNARVVLRLFEGAALIR